MLESIFNYYINNLKVTGRLARLEYFQRTLSLIAPLVIFSILIILASINNMNSYFAGSIVIKLGLWFGVIFSIAFTVYSVIAGITLNIRRLHDVNLSGWWILGIYVIQILLSGILFSVVPAMADNLSLLFSFGIVMGYFFIPGTAGKNNFGEATINYKEVEPEPQQIEQLVVKEEAEEVIEKTKSTKKTPAKKAVKKKATAKKVIAKKSATKTKTPSKTTKVAKTKKTATKKAPAKKKITKAKGTK